MLIKSPHVLATDLDGTLLPLPGNEPNRHDLKLLCQELSRQEVTVVFVTSLDFPSILVAIQEHGLPQPQWVICDGGASIYRRDANGTLVPETAYQPRAVSKADAITWWMQHVGESIDSVVYAGDSPSDVPALSLGCRAIVVGNATREVARAVYSKHRTAAWTNQLWIAEQPATSGVLEGCRWFGLAEACVPDEVPMGATPIAEQQTLFRVWAPKRKSVAVQCESLTHELKPTSQGCFEGIINVGPGTRYMYLLDGNVSRPDPRSRYQPDGVHAWSEVIGRGNFPWTDRDWQGVAKRDLIIYELHAGTFTAEGTFAALQRRIPELAELGVTAIELLPVAASPGRWNWGYDGVYLYAVRSSYGRPEDLKAFVDACHAAGIAVILDVVYNHLGPEGNYLSEFGQYFTRRHHTPWGDAFNFDGRRSEHVRQYIVDNVIQWLDEYHLDGLRLDAVHFMYDDSEQHLLHEIREAVHAYAANQSRKIHLIAESNVFDEQLLGVGRSAIPAENAEDTQAATVCASPRAETAESSTYYSIWCDCLMHAIYTHAVPNLKLTHREYRGAADIVTALQQGYVYAGSEYTRTDPSDANPAFTDYADSLILATQTHDSVGNHPRGQRLHQLVSKSYQQAAATLVLLYPSIPMLFMGEEVATASPFTFFADFEDERLRRAVDRGRSAEYPQHLWDGALLPSDPDAFYASKCHDPASHDPAVRDWYMHLISLRRQGVREGWLSAARMRVNTDTPHLFSIQYAGDARTITVYSHLAPSTSETVALTVRSEGTILLASSSEIAKQAGEVHLRPNQAIVIES